MGNIFSLFYIFSIQVTDQIPLIIIFLDLLPGSSFKIMNTSFSDSGTSGICNGIIFIKSLKIIKHLNYMNKKVCYKASSPYQQCKYFLQK